MKTHIRRQQHKKYTTRHKTKEPPQKYSLGTITGGLKPVLQEPNPTSASVVVHNI